VAIETEPPALQRPANALTSIPFRVLWLNNITFFLVANAQRFVFGWLVLDGLQRGEGQQGLVVFTLGLPRRCWCCRRASGRTGTTADGYC
jgi:hypothetical protein